MTRPFRQGGFAPGDAGGHTPDWAAPFGRWPLAEWLGPSAGWLWLLPPLVLGAFLYLARRRRTGKAARPQDDPDLQRLLETTPVPMAVLTADGTITHLNRKFVETFGYSRPEITDLNTWWPRAYPDPAYREKVRHDWCARMLGATDGHELGPYEARVTCRDGTVRTIEWRATRLGDRSLVVGNDLTERLRQSEALRTSEERFRLLIENSTELVAQVDLGGRYLYASPNHFAITGYAAEELLGRSAFDLIHPEDAPHVKVAFDAGTEHATRVYRFRFKDGSWHWLESAGRRFRTSQGVEMGAVISRDITARIEAEEMRKRLEAQLQQAQKMEAIGTLASGIAHDFNNILAGLFGTLQLAEEQLPPGHAGRPLLQASFRACVRARDLVAKILMFSRRREQRKEPQPLGPIVSEAAALLRASLPATVQIRTEFTADRDTVRCDAVQVHQVIMNLGANAAHAMRPRGGTLALRLDAVAPGPALAAGHPSLQAGRTVRLVVSDTGTGMDAATRARLFEPFFTTKPAGEGTGLGLAVVRGIVEEHHGAIRVESTPGVGTTFHVWLPLTDGVTKTAAPAPAVAPRGRGERVLFIDDEPVICDISARLLRNLGYEVAAFTRPTEAIEEFLRTPHAFAAVVSDLTMPELTGPDIVEEIRRLRPDIPVLITTGYLRADEVERARQAGVRHFLEKPFTAETLAESLRRAIQGAQPFLPSGVFTAP